MQKAPDRDRGMPHSLPGGVRVNQTVAVLTFLLVISSSARSQSSCS
jgi:hypothetical protein